MGDEGEIQRKKQMINVHMLHDEIRFFLLPDCQANQLLSPVVIKHNTESTQSSQAYMWRKMKLYSPRQQSKNPSHMSIGILTLDI